MTPLANDKGADLASGTGEPGLDVERLARAIHKTYPELREFRACEHIALYGDKHECEYDAAVIASAYDANDKGADPTPEPK